MTKILRLDALDEFSRAELEALISDVGRARSLRDAVERAIRAIHGLPAVLGAELQKIEVYVGRSGASAMHLRNRWFTRLDEFNRVPSTHAMVVATTSTARLREQRWERFAQLVVKRLQEHGALCCANALLGESGRWPATDDSVIYIVARVRKGPVGYPVDETDVNAAVAALVRDVRAENLDADVITAAADQIQDRDDADELELIEPENWFEEQVEDDEALVNCRREGCDVQARPGNYGFCGRHRPHLSDDQTQCKDCGRAAIPGNRGYCGRHRAYTPPGLKPCRTCGRPALARNWGFCGRHRKQ